MGKKVFACLGPRCHFVADKWTAVVRHMGTCDKGAVPRPWDPTKAAEKAEFIKNLQFSGSSSPISLSGKSVIAHPPTTATASSAVIVVEDNTQSSSIVTTPVALVDPTISLATAIQTASCPLEKKVVEGKDDHDNEEDDLGFFEDATTQVVFCPLSTTTTTTTTNSKTSLTGRNLKPAANYTRKVLLQEAKAISGVTSQFTKKKVKKANAKEKKALKKNAEDDVCVVAQQSRRAVPLPGSAQKVQNSIASGIAQADLEWEQKRAQRAKEDAENKINQSLMFLEGCIQKVVLKSNLEFPIPPKEMFGGNFSFDHSRGSDNSGCGMSTAAAIGGGAFFNRNDYFLRMQKKHQQQIEEERNKRRKEQQERGSTSENNGVSGGTLVMLSKHELQREAIKDIVYLGPSSTSASGVAVFSSPLAAASIFPNSFPPIPSRFPLTGDPLQYVRTFLPYALCELRHEILAGFSEADLLEAWECMGRQGQRGQQSAATRDRRWGDQYQSTRDRDSATIGPPNYYSSSSTSEATTYSSSSSAFSRTLRSAKIIDMTQPQRLSFSFVEKPPLSSNNNSQQPPREDIPFATDDVVIFLIPVHIAVVSKQSGTPSTTTTTTSASPISVEYYSSYQPIPGIITDVDLRKGYANEQYSSSSFVPCWSIGTSASSGRLSNKNLKATIPSTPEFHKLLTFMVQLEPRQESIFYALHQKAGSEQQLMPGFSTLAQQEEVRQGSALKEIIENWIPVSTLTLPFRCTFSSNTNSSSSAVASSFYSSQQYLSASSTTMMEIRMRPMFNSEIFVIPRVANIASITAANELMHRINQESHNCFWKRMAEPSSAATDADDVSTKNVSSVPSSTTLPPSSMVSHKGSGLLELKNVSPLATRFSAKKNLPNFSVPFGIVPVTTTSIGPQLQVADPQLFNTSQLEAIRGALQLRDKQGEFYCVQGPPGTGKTHTVVGMIRSIVFNEEISPTKDPYTHFKKKMRILVCTQSNAAINEIVIRLLKATGEQRSVSSTTFVPLKVIRAGIEEKIDDVIFQKDAYLDRKADRLAEQQYQLMMQNARVSTAEGGGVPQSQGRFAPQQQDKEKKLPSFQEIRRRVKTDCLGEANVVCSTLGSLRQEWLRVDRLSFDWAILDEASQAEEPSILPLIAMKAPRCILVGDPAQLRAVIKCPEAKHRGYGRSLMERMVSEGHPCALLRVQYRMQWQISMFPNQQFYGNQLTDSAHRKRPTLTTTGIEPQDRINERKCAPAWFSAAQQRTQEENSTQKSHPSAAIFQRPSWIPNVLHSATSLLFIDVPFGREEASSGRAPRGGSSAEQQHSQQNQIEATIILQLVRLLERVFVLDPNSRRNGRSEFGCNNADDSNTLTSLESLHARIGIITFYAAQRKLLEKVVNNRSFISGGRWRPYQQEKSTREIMIQTVDGFQGQEKDIIIVSCVRSCGKQNNNFSSKGGHHIGFLDDPPRVNVAITRAKEYCFIVGNADYLETAVPIDHHEKISIMPTSSDPRQHPPHPIVMTSSSSSSNNMMAPTTTIELESTMNKNSLTTLSSSVEEGRKGEQSGDGRRKRKREHSLRSHSSSTSSSSCFSSSMIVPQVGQQPPTPEGITTPSMLPIPSTSCSIKGGLVATATTSTAQHSSSSTIWHPFIQHCRRPIDVENPPFSSSSSTSEFRHGGGKIRQLVSLSDQCQGGRYPDQQSNPSMLRFATTGNRTAARREHEANNDGVNEGQVWNEVYSAWVGSPF